MESINSMASQKQDVVAEENLVLKGYVYVAFDMRSPYERNV